MKNTRKKLIKTLDTISWIISFCWLIEMLAKFSKHDTFNEKSYIQNKDILSKSTSYLQSFLCAFISSLTTINIAIIVYCYSQNYFPINYKVDIAKVFFFESIFVLGASLFRLVSTHKKILKKSSEQPDDNMRTTFESERSFIEFVIAAFISSCMSFIALIILIDFLSY